MTGGAYHWGIDGRGTRWEVDDFPGNNSKQTIHRVWVQSNDDNTTLPDLTITNKVYVDDPVGENIKAIPGNVMAFQRSIQNTGGETDNNSLNMTFNLDSNMAFQLNSVSLNDGQSIGSFSGDTVNDYNSINPSGLTLDTITYSNNSGSSFTYTPSANITDPITGHQYDDRITNVKVSTNGFFADGTSSPTGFRIYYKALIK